MNPELLIRWLNFILGLGGAVWFGVLGYDYLVGTHRDGVSYWLFPFTTGIGVVACLAFAVLNIPF